MNLSILTDLLLNKGFVFEFSDEKSHSIYFTGNILSVIYGKVPLNLIFDMRISDFPKVQLSKDIQDKFSPFHNPHIENGFYICYRDNSVVFDESQLENSIDFVLFQVKYVLDNYKKDDMNEILPEWKSYWYGENDYYFVGNQIPKELEFEGKFIINSKNPEFPEIKLYQIEKIPTIENCSWPIENIKDLFTWLDNTDIEKEIKKYIKKNIKYKTKDFSIMLFSKRENVTFGLSLNFTDPLFNIKKHHLNGKSVDSIYNGNHAIHRFWVDFVQNDVLQQSNVSPNFVSLEDKNISLIGAGTIGSNLAEILVRIGAGNKNDKPLCIIDNDKYQPENFSRHILPFHAFGKNKAEQVADFLNSLNPLFSIKGFSSSVYDYDLSNSDYIIDTTGEDCVTKYIINKGVDSTVFISWVHINGENVSTFVIPSKSREDYITIINEELKLSQNEKTTLPKRNSCSSIYVPFPVMLSQNAALLTTRCILDYEEKKIQKTMLYTQNVKTGEITIKCFEEKNEIE